MQRHEGVGAGVSQGGEGEEDSVAQESGSESGGEEDVGDESVAGVPAASVGNIAR